MKTIVTIAGVLGLGILLGPSVGVLAKTGSLTAAFTQASSTVTTGASSLFEGVKALFTKVTGFGSVTNISTLSTASKMMLCPA